MLEQQLYSVDIAKPNAITRLTERGWWNNGAAMDEAATRLIVTRSNPNQPPQTYLADAAGKRHRVDQRECGEAGASLLPVSRQPPGATSSARSRRRTARRSITR